MRLFDDYEAIKFKEENLIFITNRSYLYCIYDVKNKRWYKHHNAGYDCLSVENYKDLRKKDIIDAMGP